MERLRYELQIYPFQIDVMRHVSNIVYIQWMEIGRCLLLEAVGMPIVYRPGRWRE
jgi:acyl-CoA thioester hydrolase